MCGRAARLMAVVVDQSLCPSQAALSPAVVSVTTSSSLILNVLLAYGTGSDAMIIIVEIVSRSGTRACKEYDVPTFGSAIAAAERELRGYSDFRLVDVRTKDECPEASGEDW